MVLSAKLQAPIRWRPLALSARAGVQLAAWSRAPHATSCTSLRLSPLLGNAVVMPPASEGCCKEAAD